MTEIELKLQVPAGALAAVERALVAATVTSVRMRAVYYDTPDGRLGAAGVALRLRQEGRRWVQTLKSGPSHGLSRGEHEVALPATRGAAAPPLDPQRHAGTPPGEALARVLAECEGGVAALVPRYRTDVRRRHRLLRTRRGTVELALDVGEIVAAGPDGVERRWPVRELEIELKSGQPAAVTDVARRWASQHGLWLDTRTKAERGERLARGLEPGAQVPAVKAKPSRWTRDMTPVEAWAAVLDDTLAQALPNWSEVAAGSPSHDAVHQLRVALRRLRSAERMFQGWPGVPPLNGGARVAELFRRLGVARDRDVLQAGLGRDIDAALAARGDTPLELPPLGAPEADDAQRARDGLVLIDLMAERVTLDGEAGGPADVHAAGVGAAPAGVPPVPPPNDGADLRTLVAARLERWHGQVRRDAKRFERLDDEARHRLRKRLKRLRYGVEFGAGLYGKRAVERYVGRLQESQDGLGLYNDAATAEASYRELLPAEPRAWFALGWLERQRAAAAQRCIGELGRLRKARPFWR